MADYREENDTYGRKLYATSGDDDPDVMEAVKEAAKHAALSCPDCGNACTYTESNHTVHVCVQGHEWR